MRGVVELRFKEVFMGIGEEVVLTSPELVDHAGRVTKEFIRRLPRDDSPSEEEMHECISEVLFVRSLDSVAFRMALNNISDREEHEVLIYGTTYICTETAWFDYLRDLLRPTAQDLLVSWQAKSADPVLRFCTATQLALVMPEAEGVAEFLLRAMTERPNAQALLFLSQMEPVAEPAMVSLEAIIAESQMDADTKAAVTKALKRSGKIRNE